MKRKLIARTQVLQRGNVSVNANGCDVGHIPSASLPTLGCPYGSRSHTTPLRPRQDARRPCRRRRPRDRRRVRRPPRPRARGDRRRPGRACSSTPIEIGARVLDREAAGANADFVRGELEKVTREAEQALGERTREVSEALARKVDEAFGAESGHVTKALERHFSDDSSAAVQNRVRQVVAEALGQVQQSIVRQFSSADAQNPLAEFKQGVVRSVHQAAARAGQEPARARRAHGRAPAGGRVAARRARQARRDRGRARARHREGADVRGGGRRGDRPDRRAAGRRLRGRRRRQGRHGRGRRRGRGDRRLRTARRAGGSSSRRRTEAVAQRRAARARQGAGRPRRRLRDPGRLERGEGAGQDAAAARVQRRQADRHASTPSRGDARRSSSPTRWRGRAC